MTRPTTSTLLAALPLALVPLPSLAQPQGKVGLYSDVTITGSILEPSPIDISDDARLTGLIQAPEGVKVQVFARDLVNPRMLAVSPAGHLYATRRSVGDVVLLKDADGDGLCCTNRLTAGRPLSPDRPILRPL